MKIIMQKIKALSPNLIFIEKDASRTALEHMIKDDITVVTVTSAKMLKMIARATPTSSEFWADMLTNHES